MCENAWPRDRILSFLMYFPLFFSLFHAFFKGLLFAFLYPTRQAGKGWISRNMDLHGRKYGQDIPVRPTHSLFPLVGVCLCWFVSMFNRPHTYTTLNSKATNSISHWCLPIQGGPERMQQLWLLISWTSSMKQNCFLFYLVEHSFSNKMTPWSLVLGKVSGL